MYVTRAIDERSARVICNHAVGIVIGTNSTRPERSKVSAEFRRGITIAMLSRRMCHPSGPLPACGARSLRSRASRLVLILSISFVSVGRLHAHAIVEPAAVTQEINRCLMMVRIAATRRTATTQKPASRPVAGRDRGYDDYQVPAGTPLIVRLRSPLDSASGQVDDPIRATLLEAVVQNGAELIPKGSTLHGKVTEVQAASKQNRAGHVAIAFNVIEHSETRSVATIQTQSMPFDATLEPKEKFKDVRVESGEQLTLILATPLKVRLPKTQ